MFKDRKLKSFTLTEIFVAIIIISIIATICISFMKNRKDYSREYMYYSTYQNLKKVVDTILYEENPAYTEMGMCNGHTCIGIEAGGSALCAAIREKLNHNFGESHCIGKLANGVEFIPAPEYSSANGNDYLDFDDDNSENPLECDYSGTVNPQGIRYGNGARGCLFWVDIDGQGNGEDKLFYDIMPFYINTNGLLIPEWGEVSGVRGYDGREYDAGANSELMSFDVVYTDGNSNKLLILEGGRSVSFARAACLSGYVSGTYCNIDDTTVEKSEICTDTADCRIRLVKKLKGRK